MKKQMDHKNGQWANNAANVARFTSVRASYVGCGLLWLSAMGAATPALAQQKTGPGVMGDDALTFHGITLYGVVDIGLQYDTHGESAWREMNRLPGTGLPCFVWRPFSIHSRARSLIP